MVELSGKESSRTLLVYVTGAVRRPGVYELPEGSRFFDAVKAAGDVLPYAVMEDINMAEPLSDGMKIHIPLDPEQVDARGSGLISINAASAKELEALPGVGQVTAEKIIRYREEHGRFSSKEELKRCPLSVRVVTRRWRIRSPYDDPAGAFLECAFAGSGSFSF